MNLSKNGKNRLQQYIRDLNKLIKTVENTKPLNEFLLNQIASLQYIIGGLADAWDSTFEMSLLKNANDYLNQYNVVNGGDGSWAIALSDNNSLSLAELTKTLFADFKDNLFDYVEDLPINTKEIKIFGIKIAYADPKAIIDSAICQIQGAIQFYEYLGTERLLGHIFTTAFNKIPVNFLEFPLTNSQIAGLIQDVSQIPSSYLRNSENRSTTNNVARVMEDSLTGALGIRCQHSLNDYLESYAFAEKMQEPMVLAELIQSGNVLRDLVDKLKDFIVFAEKFSEEVHADYKIAIMNELKNAVSEQLTLLATKERLAFFYNESYSNLYIAGKRLKHYENTKQDSKMPQQQVITLAAIKSYADELNNSGFQAAANEIKLGYEKLADKTEVSNNDILKMIWNINFDIIRVLAKAPAMVVHDLLKKLSKINLEHVEMVKQNRHTLGETGDKINDLYSFLLTTFPKLTLAEEPETGIKLKLIDSLIKSMAKELSPPAEKIVMELKKGTMDRNSMFSYFPKDVVANIEEDVIGLSRSNKK